MRIFLNNSSFKNVMLLVCGFLTLSLTSCKDDDTPLPEPQPISFFSVYQGSPDAPDMDVMVGSQFLTDNAFRYSNFVGYYNAPPGNYRFRFNPVNAANSYIDSTVTFEDNKAYSLFTVGRFQEIELLVVEDILKAPTTGKAGIRFMNLSPDAPEVNVITTGTNGATLFSNVEFKEITDVIELDGGSHSFQVRRTDGEELLISLPNNEVVAGRVYTYILRGLEAPAGNPTPLSLQIIRNL